MKYQMSGLVVGVTLALLSHVARADDTEKWTPLMDGKTLAGWHAVGDGKWTVEDGAFVGRANKTRLYGLLVSDKKYGDFTVRFQFKCVSGDSGFYIRTEIKPPEQAHGLQVQVGLADSGVGGVYESYGRQWLDKPSDERQREFTKKDGWNEMIIDARGGNITVHVNGEKTADLKNDPSRPTGHLALQMHSGNLMHVMFRKIEMKK